jgi:hypothetical protein
MNVSMSIIAALADPADQAAMGYAATAVGIERVTVALHIILLGRRKGHPRVVGPQIVRVAENGPAVLLRVLSHPGSSSRPPYVAERMFSKGAGPCHTTRL